MDGKCDRLRSAHFAEVFLNELDAVRVRRIVMLAGDEAKRPRPEAETPGGVASEPRQIADPDGDEKTARLDALDMHLSGLALSGGGIRSATFALGVLQGLARLRLLRRFDYLSTVSGGGYIGGWLAAWIRRDGDDRNVETQLSSSRADERLAMRPPLAKDEVIDEEPEPIHHLRSYSNYLAARPGGFSSDAWTLLAIYIRNLAINLLVLVPMALAVTFAVRWVVQFYTLPVAFSPAAWIWESRFLGVSALLAAFTVMVMINAETARMQAARVGIRQPGPNSARDQTLRFVIPVLLTAAALSYFLVIQNGFIGTHFLIIVSVLLVSEGLRVGMAWACADGRDVSSLQWSRRRLKRIADKIRTWSGGHGAVSNSRASRSGIAPTLIQVVLPLLVVAVLGCWLLSIDPALCLDRQACMSLDATHHTRLHFTGYSLLSSYPRQEDFRVLPDWATAMLPDAGWLRDLKDRDSSLARGWWPGLKLGLLLACWLGLLRFLSIRDNLTDVWSGRALPNLGKVHRLGIVLQLLVVPPAVSFTIVLVGYQYLVKEWLWYLHRDPLAIATIGPPLVLVAVALSAAGEIMLLGRRLGEDEREWWAHVSALLLMVAAAWAGLFATVLYVPQILRTAMSMLAGFFAGGGDKTVVENYLGVVGLVVAGLVVAVAGSVTVANPGLPGLQWRRVNEAGARVAASVFLVGLLALVGLFAESRAGFKPAPFPYIQANNAAVQLLVWSLGTMGLILFTIPQIEANLFSLNSMYANRLTRCYLGASRPKAEWRQRWTATSAARLRTGAPVRSRLPDRSPNRLTGFDLNDDMPLSHLRYGSNQPSDNRSPESEDLAYRGPYLLINTAMDLVATRELDWQDRKAESFVLSPLYCGSQTTGYQRTPTGLYDAEQLTLGRAMAISGAAVDPNMGPQQSPPRTLLMTVLNTRLGWWIENPSRPLRRAEIQSRDRGKTVWSADTPKCGGQIVREALGQTDDRGPYVHLSDGGHFDNLGVYELIRRRCRYIVVCDAGADPDLAFADLANLIRRCRTDFGVGIEIDVDALRAQSDHRQSRWHVATGMIRYDDVDNGELPGLLVYLKASLTGDEPTDVREYASIHARFPHETTADQFFDEGQFESYRTLGEHIATTVFAPAAEDVWDDLKVPTGQAVQPGRIRSWFARTNRIFFSRLRRQWFPATPPTGALQLETLRICNDFYRYLRDDDRLRGLVADLYPELERFPSAVRDAIRRAAYFAWEQRGRHAGQDWRDWFAAETAVLNGEAANGSPCSPRSPATVVRPIDGADSELSQTVAVDATRVLVAVTQMLRVINATWFVLDLGNSHAHPHNRAWIDLFRRWTTSEALHTYWPILRGGFSPDFNRFCEQQLSLHPGQPSAEQVREDSPWVRLVVDDLNCEYLREWSPDDRAGRGLHGMVDAAFRLSASGRVPRPPVWFIRLKTRAQTYQCGVALVRVLPSPSLHGEQSDCPDTRSPREDFEFFVYLRPALRGLGIGRECVGRILDEVCEELAPGHEPVAPSLCVRYPKAGLFIGDRMEEARWLSFFHYYDFRGAGSGTRSPEDEFVLRCEIHRNGCSAERTRADRKPMSVARSAC
jgi:hypothetical protein